MAMRWSVRVAPEIYSDVRFHALTMLSLNHYEAIGKLVSFWSLAISHFVVGESVPRAKFDYLQCPELIQCGLAKEVEDGIRAAGEAEFFTWALAQVEKGRRGGKAKQENKKILNSTNRNDPATPSNLQVTLGLPSGVAGASQEQEQEQELITIVAKATHSTSVENPLKSKINLMIDIWNQESGSLPKVARVSAQRKAKIETRLKDEPDLEVWRKVFRAIASWPFGLGDNDRGWKASFDYALQPGTLDKFEAGAYEARTKNMATAHRNSITMQSEQPVIFNDLTERLTDEWERENARG